jgi:hypothetical protein
MRNLLSALLLLVCVSGCDMFQINRYDQMTVDQIDLTIAYELGDFQYIEKWLHTLDSPLLIEDLRMRHESELARLRAWKLMEEAKKLDE